MPKPGDVPAQGIQFLKAAGKDGSSNSVLSRLAAQAKHGSNLCRGRDGAVEFMRNSDRSLNQLSVALRFLSAGIVDVIFQADSHMSSH
jgi:hypothetical protein